ncbi:Bardet-Biedl syndrome 12 protein isoform X2 [Mugil cephalus]|nr:Bardet-Biedl syndrome 12 protein isoform X2 [Mugil cephalus]
MLGSEIINNRQHVGLQKLSALAGISHSFLGPSKKYKFVQDDASGGSALVCSCFRVVENLELTCAVGQLVHETLQAHQKVYRTGSGCLLFLAGAWSRAALDCLQRGIPVAHIISAMSEGMDVCVDVCGKCAISTERLGGTTLDGLAEASQASFQGAAEVKSLKISEQRKIKLSRHFREAKYENIPKVPQTHQPKLPDVLRIAEGLSHGCDDSMKLVIEAFQVQTKTNQDTNYSTFDVAKVVTCVLPCLPEEHSCVALGCVALLPPERTLVAHHLKGQDLKVALISGDLSHTYRHLGFNRPTGLQRVSDKLESSKEDEWVEKVLTLLLNLNVSLILISGLASEKVIAHCCRRHILVVEKVKGSVLKTFASSTGAVPVTYATQLSKHHVCTGVKVTIWRDFAQNEKKSATAVNISTGRHDGLVTVILTSCVHAKLPVLEDQFWACAYRLHHALKDRALLPGAGGAEMLCVHHLRERAERHIKNGDRVQRSKTGPSANRYSGVVLRLMADGLIDYISTVMVNTGKFSKVKARTAVSQQLRNYDLGIAETTSQLFSEAKPDEARAVGVYDNLSVKQEAWRKALDLVLLVLQTDAEVITGVSQKTENLTLL